MAEVQRLKASRKKAALPQWKRRFPVSAGKLYAK
jgi:hypothetical protein